MQLTSLEAETATHQTITIRYGSHITGRLYCDAEGKKETTALTLLKNSNEQFYSSLKLKIPEVK